MVRVSYQIKAFAGSKVIFDKQLIGVLIHFSKPFTNMICISVGSNEVKLLYVKISSESINILFSV